MIGQLLVEKKLRRDHALIGEDGDFLVDETDVEAVLGDVEEEEFGHGELLGL